MSRRRSLSGLLVNSVALLLLATGVPPERALALEKGANQKARKTAEGTTVADRDISDAIEEEFIEDRAIDFNDIDVATRQGVVTLGGVVDNLLAKERAAAVARTVKGVRAVVNTIRIEPPPRTDASIRQSIRNALLRDPATDSYEVDVKVADGVAILSGTVDSWSEKMLTANVAKGVKGVVGVRNKIIVDPKRERPDIEIQRDVEKRLNWDRFVDNALIRVSVNDGKVTLSGTTGSAAEKSRAHTLAWVSGVNDVDSSAIDVKFWARDGDLRKNKYVARSDREVARAIKDALFHDPRVASYRIDVTVRSGVVTLRGKVESLRARRAAAADARNTVGVWKVKNLIKVRGKDFPGDETLEHRVRTALGDDPYLERGDVTVSAINGRVYLHGQVDSFFEKARAEEAASSVTGVSDVRNYLAVDFDDSRLVHDPYVDGWYVDDFAWNGLARDRVTPTRTDWELRREIEDELWWSPFVDSQEVRVTVENGIATLTGSVDTWSEWRAAKENAYEGGARVVINKLQVDHGPDDETIGS